MNSIKKIKINLGCGNIYLPEYINCDFVKSLNVDKSFDLRKVPYPFKTNFADEILMDNVLEHMSDIVEVIEECHRILKKNGILKIYVPYFKCDGAFQDPTHLHYFTEHSMDYFSPAFSHNFYSSARFEIVKADLFTANKRTISKIRNIVPFKKILKYFLFNVYDGVYFEMKAIK